jgi:hypothetical protein
MLKGRPRSAEVVSDDRGSGRADAMTGMSVTLPDEDEGVDLDQGPTESAPDWDTETPISDPRWCHLLRGGLPICGWNVHPWGTALPWDGTDPCADCGRRKCAECVRAYGEP